MKRPDALSMSRLDALATCPHRYFERYVLYAPDSSDEAVRGSVFHSAASRYIKALAEAGEASDPVLASESFEEAVAEHCCPPHLQPEVSSLFYRWAETFLLDLDRFLTAEELYTTGRVRWVADVIYLDDDAVEIVDWKTHWVAMTEAQAAENWQARCYLRQAIKQFPGLRRYRMTFVYVRSGQKVSVDVGPADLGEVDDQVDRLFASLDAMHDKAAALARERGWSKDFARKAAFPARAGSHCQYCRLRCPLVDHAGLLPARLDASSASLAAEELVALEAAVRARKDALKAYCEAYGPVAVGDLEYGHRPKSFTVYPLADVLALLIDEQAPDGEALTPSEVVDLVSRVVSSKWTLSATDLGKLAKRPEFDAVRRTEDRLEFRAAKVLQGAKKQ